MTRRNNQRVPRLGRIGKIAATATLFGLATAPAAWALWSQTQIVPLPPVEVGTVAFGVAYQGEVSAPYNASTGGEPVRIEYPGSLIRELIRNRPTHTYHIIKVTGWADGNHGLTYTITAEADGIPAVIYPASKSNGNCTQPLDIALHDGETRILDGQDVQLQPAGNPNDRATPVTDYWCVTFPPIITGEYHNRAELPETYLPITGAPDVYAAADWYALLTTRPTVEQGEASHLTITITPQITQGENQ